MANLKISQLNTYTGGTGDLRFFIMNNSGETLTFKFSGYPSTLRTGSAAGSSVSLNLDPSFVTGTNSIVYGSQSGVAASTGNDSAVICGLNNRTSGNRAFVAGGQNNTASATCAIIVTNGGTAGGNNNLIAGGATHTINNGTNAVILGGSGNSISAGNDDGLSIIASRSSTLTINGGRGSFILGGTDHYINNFNGAQEPKRFFAGGIIGGINNRIEGYAATNQGSNGFPIIIGGSLCAIRSDANTPTTGDTIINSISSTISGATLSAILQSNNCAIPTGSTRTIMIGTSGRTSDLSNTTFVENIHYYRSPSTNVPTTITGTSFTVNLDNGAKQSLYLTGHSTIDFTNVRNGQSFILKTTTDGGHTISWTSTGYTFKWKGASSNPSNNKTDLWRFEVFDTQIFGELIADFS